MRQSTFKTASSVQTEQLGEWLARKLLGKKVFLFGDLGVGKTTFLCGLARGLEISSKIKSPTFVGEHIHEIPKNGELIHLDLYRAESLEIEKEKRLRELFEDSETVVVEWSERLPKKLLPKKRIEIQFCELKNEERKIEIREF